MTDHTTLNAAAIALIITAVEAALKSNPEYQGFKKELARIDRAYDKLVIQDNPFPEGSLLFRKVEEQNDTRVKARDALMKERDAIFYGKMASIEREAILSLVSPAPGAEDEGELWLRLSLNLEDREDISLPTLRNAQWQAEELHLSLSCPT